MSDCHRGVGNQGDNFLPNQNLFFAALKYYYERGFTYMELGDGDELWENRSLKRIVEIHSDAFWMMSQYYREGRFHMLYGNHDCRKQNTCFLEQHCGEYYCDSTDRYCELLKGIKVRAGIVLKDGITGHEILLVHGHQGDLWNDTLGVVSSLLVRFLWKPLELLGVNDPTRAAHNYNIRRKAEHRLNSWAEKNQIMVIAGHTHRPVLPSPGEGLYLNDGSCVHPRCITALEIENRRITLVKWAIAVCYGRQLSVERRVLEGPHWLADYWKK